MQMHNFFKKLYFLNLGRCRKCGIKGHYARECNANMYIFKLQHVFICLHLLTATEFSLYSTF